MPIDRFDTRVMLGIIASLHRPQKFLLDMFFPTVVESQSENIDFDVLTGKRRLTPLVHPTVAGKIVDNRSYEAKTFRPAYAKDKRRWKPDAPLKRLPGEQVGGVLSPEQRLDALLAQALTDQLDMLDMREEVMASELLRTGSITVAGEGYEPVIVDFGRLNTHTRTLTDNDRWTIEHADSDPLGDLEAWSGILQDDAGAVGQKVVMDNLTWTVMKNRLRQRDELSLLFDYSRTGDSRAQLGPLTAESGGRYVGSVGMFDFFVYSQTYQDDHGVTQNVMPPGTLIMADGNVEGARAYGMIQDEESGYEATRYFPKSWVDKDPPFRWLLLQSAPLPILQRPNASLCATVF